MQRIWQRRAGRRCQRAPRLPAPGNFCQSGQSADFLTARAHRFRRRRITRAGNFSTSRKFARTCKLLPRSGTARRTASGWPSSLATLAGGLDRFPFSSAVSALYRLTTAGAEAVCDLPVVLGANGMTWVGDRLLVVVVTVDVVTDTADAWLQHPLLTSADGGSPLPGINGLTVHAGYVVMTSNDRGLILRVPAASRHLADDIEVEAERLVGDDLAPLRRARARSRRQPAPPLSQSSRRGQPQSATGVRCHRIH